MKIEKVNITDLISPDYNPREITPEEMEKLKTSIQEFGYISPIIVNKHNNHIIGGNQRYEAMKQLGYTEVEVSYVNITDLNREKALNIRLNKLSGTWDNVKLNSILEDLTLDGFDVTLTGFQEVNINESTFTEQLNQDNSFNPIGAYSNGTYDEQPADYNEEIQENEYEFQELDDFKEINIDDFEGQHKCPKCGFEWND